MPESFRFIKGPFSLGRRERLTAPPGHALLLEARNGVVCIQPTQRMSTGERRFARGSYWSVSLRSPEQILSLEAESKVPRDHFELEVHYFVEVADPMTLFEKTDLEVDGLVEVHSRVRNYVRTLAARFSPNEASSLQDALGQARFGLPDYLTASCPEARVGFAATTKSRLEAEAEMEEEITRLRLRAEVEKASDTFEHDKRTRTEQNRFKLITMIAEAYKLKLDPLMLRALALDDHPSAERMDVVRNRLLQEGYDGLENFGRFFTALHEHQMLDDENLGVLMDFARRVTTEGIMGGSGQSAIGGAPPPRPLDAVDSDAASSPPDGTDVS